MDNSKTLQQHNIRLTENNININNLISAIERLPLEPSGSLSITENGEHNVKTYEKVNVKVIPTVEKNTLIFSSGNIEGGVLIL